MLDNFADVFEAKNHKGNDEIIFAIRYLEGEATNDTWKYTYGLSGLTGNGSFHADGSRWGDPMDLKTSGSQWYEYNMLLYKSFDEDDSRKNATFIPSQKK